MNVPLAQTGHEGYKISAPGQIVGQPGEKDVELKMIPNYQVRCLLRALAARADPAC